LVDLERGAGTVSTMKIVIPGGSGQVGTILARAFHGDGHEVVVLSRHVDSSQPWRVVEWDGRTAGDWTAEIDGADVVINMAGYTVNCRYHPKNRERIMQSRVDSTRVVGEAIAAATRPPRVWLQASTATIYAHRFDAPNDDLTGNIGGDEPGVPDTWNFSIAVAKAWEQTLEEAVTPQTRKVALRSAMVMSPDRGGIFDVLLGLVRKGLGGTSGRQYVSWVHEDDFVRAISWIIDHEELSGAINIASPGPLPNKEFMAAIRQANGTAIGLPALGWMLEIGAFFMRTETELILKSRRVVSTRLENSGFDFKWKEWSTAAAELVESSKKRKK